MKAYKLELLVIDFDQIGGDSIKDVIENACYPNDCINPSVESIQEADIGVWSDDHPLNKRDTARAEYARLFAASAPSPAVAVEPVGKMVCPICGKDRFKEPCPNMADECPMVADAHLLAPPALAGSQVQAAGDEVNERERVNFELAWPGISTHGATHGWKGVAWAAWIARAAKA